MARLILVSNRVAVPGREAGSRAGGLAVALRSVMRRHPGVWFGWSGRVGDNGKAAIRAVHRARQNYVLTDLSPDDMREYYHGYANRVLWPILHYRLDLAEFSRRDLSGYLRVNQIFADHLDNLIQSDDVIWVHDYHLLPLAQALRQCGHGNRIGFFHHVPFPPPEILTGLPHHERLIPAMCHYDLVGFQTEIDKANFARYLRTECRLANHDHNTYQTADRTVRIGSFPVGVETAQLARLARRAVNTPFVSEVVESLAGRTMIIGVDRLDYSKGIVLRLEAFNRFLAAKPDWRGKVTYLQITPKSRSSIPEYVDIERQIDEAAGRINGGYGEASWTPIRYVKRAHGRATLLGLYRSARVALVTPTRDGMNLVAKEFVAAQNPDDPGVLILSRFAGAASECEAALLVNPYDPDAVAAAISEALEMPLAERCARHQDIFKSLLANHAGKWGDDFLDALTIPRKYPGQLARIGMAAQHAFTLNRGAKRRSSQTDG